MICEVHADSCEVNANAISKRTKGTNAKRISHAIYSPNGLQDWTAESVDEEVQQARAAVEV